MREDGLGLYIYMANKVNIFKKVIIKKNLQNIFKINCVAENRNMVSEKRINDNSYIFISTGELKGWLL